MLRNLTIAFAAIAAVGLTLLDPTVVFAGGGGGHGGGGGTGGGGGHGVGNRSSSGPLPLHLSTQAPNIYGSIRAYPASPIRGY